MLLGLPAPLFRAACLGFGDPDREPDDDDDDDDDDDADGDFTCFLLLFVDAAFFLFREFFFSSITNFCF